MERRSEEKEKSESIHIYIVRLDMCVCVCALRLEVVGRCAIDAAFFTSLDVAVTFCEFHPRMPDETPPSPPPGGGSI